MSSSASSSINPAVSNQALQTAVVRLVRAAVGAREQLSARGIRLALEAEFACDLRASKHVIVRAIHAALEEEVREEKPVHRDMDDNAANAKRRKLFLQ